MTPALIFNIHLVLGYSAWALCFGTYVWPKLRSMNLADASRAIATLHSFRFFGLIFIMPGIIGPAVPSGFAVPAAWGDLATALLAMLALISFRVRPLFWPLVIAFNLVGALDLGAAYYHAVRLHLPEASAQLGPAYLIPILYVPVLVMSHAAAFILIKRSFTGTPEPTKTAQMDVAGS